MITIRQLDFEDERDYKAPRDYLEAIRAEA